MTCYAVAGTSLRGTQTVSEISDAKEAVAQAVKTAIPQLNVYAYVPEGFTPPAALIVADDPYLTNGPVYGETTMNLLVIVALAEGDNLRTTQVQDALLVDVRNALIDGGYAAKTVGAPFKDEKTYGAPLIMAEIPLNTTFKNKEA